MSVLTTYPELQAICERIDACLSQREWLSLPELLAQRQQCIEKLFPPPGALDEQTREQLGALAQELFRIDDYQKQLLSIHQEEIRNLQNLLNQGRRAINAYGG
jgi:Flagellar protein FliT